MKFDSIYIAFAIAACMPCAYADSEPPTNACMLPPSPTNGQYKVNKIEDPDPAKAYEFLALNYSCSDGYKALGNKVRLCIKGTWSSDEPKCLRMCKLIVNPSVEYACVNKGVGLRDCKELEPEGTLVRARCQENYYTAGGGLPNMRCINGNWDYLPNCLPECGIFPPTDDPARPPWSLSTWLVQIPWFATIYRISKEMQYRLRCGSTLISKNVILTAAHCLWDTSNNKTFEPEEFKVAVGKKLLGFDLIEDGITQISDVTTITVLPYYTSKVRKEFSNDLAVATLARDFTFGPNVRPVCLDFDLEFEKMQFQQKSTLGLTAGWGPVAQHIDNKGLKVLEFPYVPRQECQAFFSQEYRGLITLDTFCAGNKTGIGLCIGDSGGGIAFPEEYRGVTRYYLRGVIGISPIFEPPCIKDSLNVFTKISSHENFIKEFI